MSSFTSPLRLEPVGSRTFRLIDPFAFRFDAAFEAALDHQCVDVPAGFVTDFASVPRLLWPLFPPWGRYGKAAVMHDYLYQAQPCSRALADLMFLRGMQVLGVGRVTRYAMYGAVRAAGWLIWKAHKAKARRIVS